MHDNNPLGSHGLGLWVVAALLWAGGGQIPCPAAELSGATSMAGAAPGAQGLVQHAQELAERGAVYSAQAEFVQVLKLVAQSLDAQQGATPHGDALTAGLQAMLEADDFAPADARRGNGMDLSRLIAMHRTPLLKQADASQLTPLRALQAYYSFAQKQLALAGGHETAASMALYGWARLQTVIGERSNIPKAVALHQAAVAVDPRNFPAANELAVLMARCGALEEARQLLLHSLSMCERSETWHNLAVVYEGQGQNEQALRARNRCQELLAAERARQQADSTAGGKIYWVNNEAFAQHSNLGSVQR